MLLSCFKRRSLMGFLVVVVVVFLTLPLPSHSQTVVDLISRELRFSTLVTMLTAARLTDTLNSDGPFTVFAPTNQAIVVSRINATRYLQQEWSNHLMDLLTYHVTLQDLPSAAISQGNLIQSASPGVESIRVTTRDDGINLLVLNGNATVTQRDNKATNGLVQVVDHVLLPLSASQTLYEFVSTDPNYSILSNLIEKAGLVDALNNNDPTKNKGQTLFAPTNEAFAPLMQGGGGRGWNSFINDPPRVRNLLLYHLVEGNIFRDQLRSYSSDKMIPTVQGSTIDITVVEVLEGGEWGPDDFNLFLNTDSEVAVFDTLAKNGVFHTIDRVLIPPLTPDPTIAELLEESQSSLTIFEDAARRTGLWDILNNPTQTLTVFAAVDAGFQDRGPEFLKLLEDDNFYLHLKAAMEYQVVTTATTALLAEALAPNLEMPTLLSPEESLTVTQGHPSRPIIVNFDSIIQIPDLVASNGVLQVVDQVVLPPFMELGIVDVIAQQPFVHSTLIYLLVLTGLIPDLSSNGPYTIFAPTNAAFEQLIFNAGLLTGTDWTSNIDTMREILRYHVVPAVVYEEELVHDSIHKTLQGGTISSADTAFDPLPPSANLLSNEFDESKDEGGEGGKGRRRLQFAPEMIMPQSQTIHGEILLDNRARILKSNQFGFNGVVHTIDSVLIPTWNENYKPQHVGTPEEALNNQYCIQWGQFEELCCPILSESNNNIAQEVAKKKQNDRDIDIPEHCQYIVFPNPET